MSIAFYAGSFDPFTVGHLHIVKTACEIFDKVIVGIGINEDKTRNFNIEEMKKSIVETLINDNITNVECVSYTGLTIDEMKKYNANFLVRGIRSSKDYDVEENLAKINKKLGGVDTIFLRADKYDIVSSSLVNSLRKQGRDYKEFLPEPVYKYVSKQ